MTLGRGTDIPDGAARWALLAIIVSYLVLGTLYAFETPAWQAPDEPAHFNYVKHVAENGRLPELCEGDFPHVYLEMLKKWGFPPEQSIERIRYESHQPPLYYVLAAGAYRLASLFPGLPMPQTLRLFSLGLGALFLWVTYRLVRVIYPSQALVALGAAAFCATLPMHLAVTGSVNNDVLVELLLATLVWQLVRSRAWTFGRAVGIGALLGLALLTKVQAYVGFGLALFALAWDAWRPRDERGHHPWGRTVVLGMVMLATALVIASPWLLRNARLYGPTDLLGLQRHDQVVEGQLTTREYLAQHGPLNLLRSFVVTTFQSFWGQFGWMGVVLHFRYYMAWAIFSGLVLVGLAIYLARVLRGAEGLSPEAKRGLLLLLVWAAATTLGYLWYNTKYVQHQGRYLFPALVPWAVALALGLREILGRSTGLAVLVAAALGVGVLGYSIFIGNLKEFTLLLLVALVAALLGGHRLERRWPGAAMGLAYLGLAVLALVCLYAYIVPQLANV